MKAGLIFFFVFLLIGCTELSLETQNKDSDRFRESILIKANNYQGLLQLYRERLKEKDDPETQLKVAECYYMLSDYEASRYFLKPLLNHPELKEKAYLLQAKNLLDTGDKQGALQAVNKVIAKLPKDGAANNIKGIILAEQGDFNGALNSFNIARKELVDDEVVMNNMAMIAILREDYSQAIEYLMPIYNRGNNSNKIVHNLIFALVKDKRYEDVEAILKKEKMTENLNDLIESFDSISSIVEEKKYVSELTENKESELNIPVQPEAKQTPKPVTPLIDNANQLNEETENSLQANTSDTLSSPPLPETADSNLPTNEAEPDEKKQLKEQVSALNVSPLGSVSNSGVTSISSAVETASILSSQTIDTSSGHNPIPEEDKNNLPLLGSTDPSNKHPVPQTLTSTSNKIDSKNEGNNELKVTVKGIRIGKTKNVTRLVIESDKLIRYSLTDNLDNKNLIVELKNVELNDIIRNIRSYLKPNNKTIERIMLNSNVNGNLQLLFDFKNRVKVNVFNLPPNTNVGNRLVLDFTDKN